ncbi:hypothetical protein BKA59DRAFT_492455 [Fusarium tricinctum]|uniref:ATPase AAA-type core domain-containing protein n=1 Tax=Fusarium tricinctum TaxID=61284 RepID=A0A8K0S6K3_9HYPO|nr:hypothetical protein BKA59DRAFT_492455 [Fusarium tricinctum]
MGYLTNMCLGGGIIMPLGGEPGTVAEATRKPLYRMSAGELGVMAHGVESDLEHILEFSTRWGAVLLVDEYDVFFERHSLSDMDRNRLGPIFLWLLRYYQGIRLLTANRLSTFYPPSKHLAHEDLNRRQIENVVKTARLITTNERTQLIMKHINTTLRMRKGLTSMLLFFRLG